MPLARAYNDDAALRHGDRQHLRRNPYELAQAAGYLHELSGGRFTLGLGVSHQPFNDALGVTPGKPVPDMRKFVRRLGAAGPEHGGLPPVYLAALRPRMMALAASVADGVLIANLPLSRAREATAPIPEARRAAGFWVGNIVPVCVSDDRATALAALRQREMVYVTLPYYMNFWRENGYQDEVDRLERTYKEGGPEAAAAAMDERWLADVAIFGNRRQVRERIEEWQAAGVSPVIGPVSTTGDPFDGFRDVMDALK
jgi:alkanesulfonate monooxygenase SsuD/methylene tetrahydromethanopterin reductase-like flavin-dependent oxidoreductase (luciferase family)